MPTCTITTTLLLISFTFNLHTAGLRLPEPYNNKKSSISSQCEIFLPMTSACQDFAEPIKAIWQQFNIFIN